MRPDFSLDIRAVSERLADPDTLATTLLCVALSAYGDELLGSEELDIDPMDPIELWSRLETDFRCQLPLQAENRLNALLLALTTDQFYEDPLVFTAVCNGLYEGQPPDLVGGFIEQLAGTLTLPEALWGVFEVALVRDDDLPLGPPVMRLLDHLVGEESEEDIGLPEQVIPYQERFVEEMKGELIRQLTDIGIDRKLLVRIRATDPTPYHDDQGVLSAMPVG